MADVRFEGSSVSSPSMRSNPWSLIDACPLSAGWRIEGEGGRGGADNFDTKVDRASLFGIPNFYYLLEREKQDNIKQK